MMHDGHRRRFDVVAAAAALLVLFSLSLPVKAEERVVNFYNWSNYMAPDVLEHFTKETGIKVVYDTFDANETLETRLLAGKSGYDVVVPTAYFLQRQIKANIFQKLDKSKMLNLANFSDCGIHMLDSADDIFPAALGYLGLDPNSTRQADLEKAVELVMKIRPYVRKFHSSEYLS